MTNLTRSALLFATALAACSAGADGDLAPVFARKTLAEARAAVRDTERILVVKATASWCVPCKQMDETTWRDPRVESWFREHGLAIALDVDAAAKDAKALRIEAMPTMVAFHADREVDRITGYKDARQLLAWLGDVARGESRTAKLLERAHGVADGSLKLACFEMFALERELANAGHPDEALELLAQLWATMLDEEPAARGLRGSYVVWEMARMASRHAPAKARFTAMRDALEVDLEPTSYGEEREEWVLLNGVLGDDWHTLSWLAGALDDPKARGLLYRLGPHIERMLVARNRWVELGQLIGDPRVRILTSKWRSSMSSWVDLLADSDLKKEMAESRASMQRRTFAIVHAAMIGAGRAEDAEWVRKYALSVEDSAAMRESLDQLTEHAMRARAAAQRPR